MSWCNLSVSRSGHTWNIEGLLRCHVTSLLAWHELYGVKNMCFLVSPHREWNCHKKQILLWELGYQRKIGGSSYMKHASTQQNFPTPTRGLIRLFPTSNGLVSDSFFFLSGSDGCFSPGKRGNRPCALLGTRTPTIPCVPRSKIRFANDALWHA